MRGRKEKKGEKGTATFYITRAAAVRRLQVSLKDFRRLCILKGVYPREPKKKFKGGNKTYYYLKDIAFLQHEPVLETFRAQKAQLKKIARAKGVKDRGRARALRARLPRYDLDHLVRERYPSFVDALRGLDDALCLVFLFAQLPGTHRLFTPARSGNCQRLSREWLAILAHSHSLKKVFFSIKGVYYQAVVGGQTLTWIVPYEFPIVMPDDVDQRVMLTFLEFYETLLGFVLFKLFADAGFRYPPNVSTKTLIPKGLAAPAAPAAPNANANGSADAAAAAGDDDDDEGAGRAEDDKIFQRVAGPGGQAGASSSAAAAAGAAASSSSGLFASLVFFLNREVPQTALTFIVRSGGGAVVHREASPAVTHHVMDRPLAQPRDDRIYVVPQWVADCQNAGVLLPVDRYLPGTDDVPAHLSPFVDDEAEGYVPERAKELQQLVSAAKASFPELAASAAADDDSDDDSDNDVDADGDDDDAAMADGGDSGGDDDDNDDDDADDDSADDDDEDNDDDDNDDEDGGAAAMKRKTAAGSKASASKKAQAQAQAMLEDAPDSDDDDADQDGDGAKRKAAYVKRAVAVMGKRDKRLYSKIQYGLDRKRQRADQLQERARAAAALKKKNTTTKR